MGCIMGFPNFPPRRFWGRPQQGGPFLAPFCCGPKNFWEKSPGVCARFLDPLVSNRGFQPFGGGFFLLRGVSWGVFPKKVGFLPGGLPKFKWGPNPQLVIDGEFLFYARKGVFIVGLGGPNLAKKNFSEGPFPMGG